MKVLLLNPEIDAQHQFVQGLIAKHYAVLLCKTPLEARQLIQLHGGSLDLLIVHRELDPKDLNAGVKFLEEFRKKPETAEMAAILTTSSWTTEECATHQQSGVGANAYVSWPVTADSIQELVSQIFVETTGHTVPLGQSAEPPTAEPPTAYIGSVGQSEEEPSVLLEVPTAPSIEISGESNPDPTLGIQLEAPAAESQTIPTVIFDEPESLTSHLTAQISPQAETGQTLYIPITPEHTGTFIESLESTRENLSEETNTFAHTMELPGLPPDPISEDKKADSHELHELHELKDEMPYLFEQTSEDKGTENESVQIEFSPKAEPSRRFSEQPVLPEVPSLNVEVPQESKELHPDVETLKSYLLLREQDVLILSAQTKAAQEQVKNLLNQIALEKARNTEFSHEIERLNKKINEFEEIKNEFTQKNDAQINELIFQIKTKDDKIKLLESRDRDSTEEMDRLRERVRADIRKIRVKEKDLENRLEILKKDSDVLIGAREAKIIELKRKVDLLEFNLDLLQDQLAKEKERTKKFQNQLEKAAQVVRVAGGLLGPSDFKEAQIVEEQGVPSSEFGRKIS